MGEGLSPPTPLVAAGECDLDAFSCGEPSLDGWLRRRARSSEGKYARTYVVLVGRRVVAYYCLGAGSVPLADLPSAKYRRNAPDPVPALVLGRMAVDRAFQGRGLGGDLVGHCFKQCLAAALIVGVRALVVHPLNERVAKFYEMLGFLPLRGVEPAMFLPVETIERCAEPGS